MATWWSPNLAEEHLGIMCNMIFYVKIKNTVVHIRSRKMGNFAVPLLDTAFIFNHAYLSVAY